MGTQRQGCGLDGIGKDPLLRCAQEGDGRFLWLPNCGLLGGCELYRKQGLAPPLQGSIGLATTGWKERRDGSLQLGRLAASRFERTMEGPSVPLSMEQPQ